MDLRYISYAGGNFLSCQPEKRPAAAQHRLEANGHAVAAPSPAAAIAAAVAEIARNAPAAVAPTAPSAPPPAAEATPPPPSAPRRKRFGPAPTPIAAPTARATEKPAAPPAPVPAAAPTPAPTPAVPSNFDLVSVDDVHFEPAHPEGPEGPPVDVRELFTSNEIPGAMLVTDAAALGAIAPPKPAPPPAAPAAAASPPAAAKSIPPPNAPSAPAGPTPTGPIPARADPTQAELTAQAVARLAERRAREAARHAEREAERRARKEATLAERHTRELADKARENAARLGKEAQRQAKQFAREKSRRERARQRAQARTEKEARIAARPPLSPESTRRRLIAANAASALGLVLAIGAAAWYFAAAPGRASPNTGMSAAASPATPVKGAVPVASPHRAVIPHVPQASLLSLAGIESQTERRSFQTVVRVQRGEIFQELLMRAGVYGAESQKASISLAGVYDVRKMKPGQLVTVDFGILGDEHNRFLGVRFDSNFDRTVWIQRQARGDFVATEIKKEIITQILRTDGVIDHSVFQAGLQAGLPPEPVVRMINLFAYDVDFQRDVQKGDSFETLIEQHKDPRGDIVRHGNILFASLTLQGQTIKLYRWQGEDGEVDYFSETGHSSKKALMRTPIDGARLSSGFGYRRHPVLGYSKLHQGTDFAAPSGTPIYAAGAGQIEKIGWQGGYGNAIIIRHNKEYSTLYGHMSGFAPGMSPGKRVKQGDIIGFVGSTGMSTGPHLHYEVHVNSKPIDPLSLKLPSRQRLQGQELARYLDYVKTVNQRFQQLAKTGATGHAIVTASEQEADNGCVNGVRLDPTDKRACEQ